ncbi:hypothetical protein GCM10009799_24320 [Nocardiopsis rhodophaea]|uniref:Uncharacterized protein n=1 Tax=Nocardiopsis rhodophaea TaxID=280238 RepID=A0ABN2T1G3_9ACTN
MCVNSGAETIGTGSGTRAALVRVHFTAEDLARAAVLHEEGLVVIASASTAASRPHSRHWTPPPPKGRSLAAPTRRLSALGMDRAAHLGGDHCWRRGESTSRNP